MKPAEEYFNDNAPDNDNVIIAGKGYSRNQCIRLMESYAKELLKEQKKELLRQFDLRIPR